MQRISVQGSARGGSRGIRGGSFGRGRGVSRGGSFGRGSGVSRGGSRGNGRGESRGGRHAAGGGGSADGGQMEDRRKGEEELQSIRRHPASKHCFHSIYSIFYKIACLFLQENSE